MKKEGNKREGRRGGREEGKKADSEGGRGRGRGKKMEGRGREEEERKERERGSIYLGTQRTLVSGHVPNALPRH